MKLFRFSYLVFVLLLCGCANHKKIVKDYYYSDSTYSKSINVERREKEIKSEYIWKDDSSMIKVVFNDTTLSNVIIKPNGDAEIFGIIKYISRQDKSVKRKANSIIIDVDSTCNSTESEQVSKKSKHNNVERNRTINYWYVFFIFVTLLVFLSMIKFDYFQKLKRLFFR